MSKLSVLKDKDSGEVTSLLSRVASSLLPTPNVSNTIHETRSEYEAIKAVLSEVRSRLRVGENDESLAARSKIYAFLSEELSKATLSSDAIREVESRLGSKGELHPSRYEVEFAANMEELLAAAGNKRGNIIDAVHHPDHVVHLKARYLSDQRDPRLTISLKSIATKRSEDRFLLFVYSFRHGRVQSVAGAYRVYLSEVSVDDPTDPIGVVRSFAQTFGKTFTLGRNVSKFMVHEKVTLENLSDFNPYRLIDVHEGEAGKIYAYILIGNASNIADARGDIVYELILGFVLDHSKYWSNLRKHHVPVRHDIEELHTRNPLIKFLNDKYKL